MNWDLLTLLKQLVKENRLSVSDDTLEQAFQSDIPSPNEDRAVFQIIRQIIRASPNNTIGLKVGKLINPNSFHGLGYLFMTAENLLMACQRISEFPGFYQNLVQLTVTDNDQHMVFQVSNEAKDPLTRSVINEATLGIIYQYTNWLSQEIIDRCDLYLQHAPINDRESYQKYFHRQPQFKQSKNCLELPIQTALVPLLTSEPEYHAALYSKLKEKHDRISQSFLARAQLAIRDSLKVGSVSRRRVASQLSLSEKTLERRLSQYNYSYRELIDSIRLELAQKYLLHTQYSIEDIAKNLGYCDRSTFSKAYKKWTGVTPGNLRQRNKLH